MGPSIEQQREKIRQQEHELSFEALKKRQENRFYLCDYFVKGIYFLYLDGRIVYIGKSDGNVFKRICDHFKDDSKKFDSFTFRKCYVSDKELLKIERDLIKQYNPIYNTVHNKYKKRARVMYRG